MEAFHKQGFLFCSYPWEMEEFFPHCTNREINTEKKWNCFHIRWSWTDCEAGNRPEKWGAKTVGFRCLLVLPLWNLQQTAVVNVQKVCRGTQKILWLLGIFWHESVSFWFAQFFVWLKKYSKLFEIAYRQIHCYYVFKYINIYVLKCLKPWKAQQNHHVAEWLYVSVGTQGGGKGGVIFLRIQLLSCHTWRVNKIMCRQSWGTFVEHLSLQDLCVRGKKKSLKFQFYFAQGDSSV